MAVQTSYESLMDAYVPAIIHWNEDHFVVLHKIKRNKVLLADPAVGLVNCSKEDFIQNWIGPNANENSDNGVVLLLDPTPKFYDEDETEEAKFNFNFLSRYFWQYKAFIFQLIIGLVTASILQLIFPFLTQSIVDVGIKNQDFSFVLLVLVAQLTLFTGRTVVEILRSWILLHLSTRINIALISDFFIKLMKLPISYFDVRMTGDLLQRIQDHTRIEKILTTSSLSVLFSMVNLVVFSFVLAYYNLYIFSLFVIGSFLYVAWILLFFKKRRKLDHKKFGQMAREQSKMIELINGMQEIKLHNAEKQKRWGWESIQAKLYKISIQNLTLEQFQNVGASFINEVKNILITVLAAQLVINGDLTLGMMLAITYIIGQLNSPIIQLIDFLKELQDAKIGLERLGEIHEKEEEDSNSAEKITEIPTHPHLLVNNLSFSYPGTGTSVLNNLNLLVPANKTTAIVGVSGSGKTTLMKLLLKFYQADQGHINIGPMLLDNLSQKTWRHNIGAVMQEGYIFNDTIARNIAIGEEFIDTEQLKYAVETANIRTFIETLPQQYNTMIGQEGMGLSVGQKQRIFIARAVYKNPKFLFFDEATSALDANNEKVIMENLNQFFQNRTVVVIAHRLSTVKNADQIVVLDQGSIIEKGNHKDLIAAKGNYYHLVKNQLELGN